MFEDDSSERRENHCVECGAPPPPTDTNYTLISSRHGWRLSRSIDKHGNKRMEWRCPSCWAVYRAKAK